jgi:hypothetical protein
VARAHCNVSVISDERRVRGSWGGNGAMVAAVVVVDKARRWGETCKSGLERIAFGNEVRRATYGEKGDTRG